MRLKFVQKLVDVRVFFGSLLFLVLDDCRDAADAGAVVVDRVAQMRKAAKNATRGAAEVATDAD